MRPTSQAKWRFLDLEIDVLHLRKNSVYKHFTLCFEEIRILNIRTFEVKLMNT